MSKFPVRHALAARTWLGALSVFGCMAQVKVTPIADRTYQVECEQALTSCLVRVQEMCSAHGYDVLTASERRETSGPSPVQNELVKASATVRCRQAVPLFGADPNPPPPPIASVAPPTAAPPSSSTAPLLGSPLAAPSSAPAASPSSAPAAAPSSAPAASSAAAPSSAPNSSFAPSSAAPPSDTKPNL
jgi:hypothetical protein